MSDKKKGNTQHRMFQCAILIIVGVFCYLIISFLSIEIFHTRTKTEEHIFQINKPKYQILLDKDINYDPVDCVVVLFYMKHLTKHVPCVIRKANDQKLTEMFEKILKAIQDNNYEIKEIVNHIKPEFETTKMLRYINATLIKGNIDMPTLENKNLLLLQLEKDASFVLSPIMNLKNFDVYKKEGEDNISIEQDQGRSEITNEENFTPIISRTDLFNFPDTKHLVKFDLQEGDILFVPAYFFVQSKSQGSTVKYEYRSTSRTLDVAFKVLFDDVIPNDG